MRRACRGLIISRFDRPLYSALDSFKFASFSTSTEGTEIKARLRDLYKRVHPDLFHSLPEAQKTNEKSFKLLQEYLTFGKEGGPFGYSAGVPYKFEFYLRQGPHALDQTTGAQEPESDDLPASQINKVSVVLPPPGRLGGHSNGSGEMSMDLQRAIAKLLRACGLNTSIQDDESPLFQSFSEMPADFVFSREKLSQFVVEAAELIRQNEARQFGPRQQMSAARTALRIGRQVTASFVGSARNEDAVVKVKLLQQLAAALDRAHEDVAGLTFLIGDAYGADKQGRVRLDRQDDVNMWTGYMWQIDLDSCRERHQVVAALKRLESSVAGQLGVGLIFSEEHLALEDRYRQCLESLASCAAAQGAILRPPASDVAIRIVDLDSHSQQGLDGNFDVDREGGALVVPVAARAEDIFDFCQTHGRNLRNFLASQQEEREQLEHLRHNTERRLLLRKLSLDPKVSRPRLRSACLRLTKGAEKLRGLLDGLSIRISHVNQVSGESNQIDVAWNFEV